MSRRQGETLSRHHLKNGYTPKTTQSLVGPKAAKTKQKKAPKAYTSGAFEQTSSALNDAHASHGI
ncbi:hypothetical protein EMIT0P260_80105 [Pseudomonas sp. IT-P260]